MVPPQRAGSFSTSTSRGNPKWIFINSFSCGRISYLYNFCTGVRYFHGHDRYTRCHDFFVSFFFVFFPWKQRVACVFFFFFFFFFSHLVYISQRSTVLYNKTEVLCGLLSVVYPPSISCLSVCHLLSRTMCLWFDVFSFALCTFFLLSSFFVDHCGKAFSMVLIPCPECCLLFWDWIR